MVWLSVFPVEAGLHEVDVGAVVGRLLVVEEAPPGDPCVLCLPGMYRLRKLVI